MKAVVYKGPYEVAVEDVEDPVIQAPSDVIVRITSTAICGSDLHMYEGRTDAEPGITFGHENMGIVEEVGSRVSSVSQGDRVVRSEEHTSELQSRGHLVCRLLLEKKKTQ